MFRSLIEANGPHVGIVGGVKQATNAGPEHGATAHQTGLSVADQFAGGQAGGSQVVTADRLLRQRQCQQLGMGGGASATDHQIGRRRQQSTAARLEDSRRERTTRTRADVTVGQFDDEGHPRRITGEGRARSDGFGKPAWQFYAQR